jgi:hypothetical protein
MSDKDFSPPSLSQHFTPPDDFTGSFGWLCGYSADAGFMNLAAERFTGLTDDVRAASGRTWLGVMLDAGTAQLTRAAVPGVAHLPARLRKWEYRLLHAKVAVLGFRCSREPARWKLRLLVSTGNWTTETLQDSLDLMWRVDIGSDELSEADADVRSSCADFAAAWDMLTWLRQRHDDSVLSVPAAYTEDSESSLAVAALADWIGLASRKRRGTPRFIDSRSSSMLSAVLRTLRENGKNVARNYLAMGSGFYEGGADDAAVPAVLLKVVDSLERNGWLTSRSETKVVVNPDACQAIAAAAKSMRARGWAICGPGDPTASRRFLHAKFLFSANRRTGSNNCSSAWLYLGSGNLTKPGFTSRMSATGGNLEAGVVFCPEGLQWKAGKHIDPSLVVSNLLPIGPELDDDPRSPLGAGDEMEAWEALFAALPVSYFRWQEAEGGGGWLRADAGCALDGVQVLGCGGTPCEFQADQGFRWRDEMPRQVEIRWEQGVQSALVPVVDQFGRIAAAPLVPLDLELVAAELDRFPDVGDDRTEDGDGGGVDEVTPPPGTGASARSGATGQYAVRRIMEMIEQIADKQCAIAKADWPAWCHRLEQVLGRAQHNVALAEFAKLRLNPLSPLRHAAFVPRYAESDTPERYRYEQVLGRLEKAWAVEGFDSMGPGQ